MHWIPPEFFEIPNLCKTHVAADIYAVGTTLWQLFSMGEKPPTDLPIPTLKAVRRLCLSPLFVMCLCKLKFSFTLPKQKYLAGWRLPKPNKCPPEIYRIMYDCWLKIPDARKQPQAMVRDVHQILYHCKFIYLTNKFFSLHLERLRCSI